MGQPGTELYFFIFHLFVLAFLLYKIVMLIIKQFKRGLRWIQAERDRNNTQQEQIRMLLAQNNPQQLHIPLMVNPPSV